MKCVCYVCFTIILLFSTTVHASNKHLLTILQPDNDSILLELKDALAKQANNVSFVEYKPITQSRTLMPESLENLSHGKEAYEFLRFEESIKFLHNAETQLKTNSVSDKAIELLRETYLYLAMDYLALDKIDEARLNVDAYLCISRNTTLDPNIWPPNLIELIKQQQGLIKTTYVTITTIPPEAYISIDGNSVGTSPMSINLPTCTHYLHIAKPSYLTKDLSLDINQQTNFLNIALEIDPMSTTDEHISDAQTKLLANKYHVEGILILTHYFTNTSLQKKVFVNVKLIDVQTNKIETASIEYKDPKQAMSKLLNILNKESKNNSQTQIKGFRKLDDEKKQSSPKSWYKNKWLWATCGVALVGGIIYATTQNEKGHTSTTGTISIKW